MAELGRLPNERRDRAGRLMRGRARAALCLVLWATACGESSAPPATAPAETAVDPEAVEREANAVLDDWHDAAAAGDGDRFMSRFDGVFLGPSPEDRLDNRRLQARVWQWGDHAGWRFRSVRRELVVHEDGAVVWFDEDLETDRLGDARGTGVLRRGADGALRIAQYSLSVPIPDVFARRVRAVLAGETPRASDPDLIEIVPGDRAGPIRLGMRRAEVEALGILRPHPIYPSVTVPYDIRYDQDDRVFTIEVDLAYVPSAVRIGDVVVPPRSDFETTRALLGDCVDALGTMGRYENHARCCRGGLSVLGGAEALLAVDALPSLDHP